MANLFFYFQVEKTVWYLSQVEKTCASGGKTSLYFSQNSGFSIRSQVHNDYSFQK